ncbi:MAG TPA: succinate dehydrogenase cytochrome b subunit [Gemmatimonadales bacterium]|nr:succinate dehydrogenase cytochrome b subunit [Gemmatimonadales bacterium]
MRRVATLYRSSVGKKVLMAVTGAILFVWILGHLEGNLKIFEGPDRYNAYAEGLRSFGAPFFGPSQFLWLVRVVLLFCVVVHMLSALQLTLRARAARPIAYQQAPHLEDTYASRTMRWGGIILLLYVIFHLMDLTWGMANPDFIPGNVYHNVVASFSRWPVAGVYVIAMAALALHLYHGVVSALQTLGANHPKFNKLRRSIAAVIAVAIFVGFTSIPVAVLTGYLQ